MGQRGRPRHADILTPREWEVLTLLREGLSNPEIAERLGISRDGAKYHVSEILSKLGLSSREEAARWQPAERQPWWTAAGAPVVWLWRNSPGVIATAAFAAAFAGLALLALTIACQANGSSRPTRELAYIDDDDVLWLVDVDTDERRRLASDARCGRFPTLAWSPDRQTLACFAHGDEGRIVLWDADGALLADLSLPGLTVFSWSPRGDAFIYLADVGLVVRDYQGDAIAELGPWEEGLVLWGRASYGFPWWSPDGEQLVYRTEGTQEMRVLSLDSSATEVVSGDLRPLAWALDGEALVAAANFTLLEGSSFSAYDVYVVDPVGGLDPESRRVPELDDRVQFWLSPDGAMAALVVRGDREDGLPSIRLLDLETGVAQPIEDSLITRGSDSIRPESVAFTSDGETLLWQSDDLAKTLYRFDIASEKLNELSRVNAFSVAWSPEFQLMAYSELDDPSDTVTLRISQLDGSGARDVAGPFPGTSSGTLPFTWRPTS